MKKLLTILFLVLLSSFIVYAAQESNMGSEKGSNKGNGDELQVGTQQQTENQGESQQIMAQTKSQTQAGNVEQVREIVQQRQQEMEQNMEGMNEKEQNTYRNQNQVRLSVHALLSMEDMVGGIGQQVSEIARGFNNSVQATIRAEEKIQSRSGFAKFFMGGDSETAGEIEAEVNQNRNRIQELSQLKEQCECGEEVKAMFQEQIQNMEQEQNRLEGLAQAEKSRKGIFGWMFK